MSDAGPPNPPSLIEGLALYLKTLIETDPTSPLLEIIDNPPYLLEALDELNSLVEMDDLKQAVIQQIQLMLILACKRLSAPGSSSPDKFDGHMLHTVLYGPPGVGKSRAARCIAKIFHGLGITAEMKRHCGRSEGGARPTVNVRVIPDPTIADSIASEAGSILHTLNSSKQSAKKVEEKYPNLVNEVSKQCSNIISLCQPTFTSEGGPTLPEETVSEPQSQPFTVCGRTDFVGEYAGQTTPKTQKFLMEHRGQVIIIEEAYLLYTGEKDQFGMEALTELNRFMDEHAKEIVVIMTGYRDLMARTIFQVQEGLRRRCQLVFDIRGYTAEGLARIFTTQLKALDWKLDPQIDLNAFFQAHAGDFKAYGGDTEKLAYQAKLAVTQALFKGLQDGTADPKNLNYLITEAHLLEAYRSFLRYRVAEEETTKPPEGMYL